MSQDLDGFGWIWTCGTPKVRLPKLLTPRTIVVQVWELQRRSVRDVWTLGMAGLRSSRAIGGPRFCHMMCLSSLSSS